MEVIAWRSRATALERRGRTVGSELGRHHKERADDIGTRLPRHGPERSVPIGTRLPRHGSERSVLLSPEREEAAVQGRAV